MPIVESVDQRNEPLGFVAPGRVNDRDCIEDHRMEPPRKFEKIGGSERNPAKISKGKARHIGAGLRHMHRVAEHIEGHRRAPLLSGQTPECAGQRRCRARVRGHEIDCVIAQLLQPEIGFCFEARDLHPLFDHSNERQEERPIETILVEEIRAHIGSRDDHHAPGKQSLEQAAKDHRIGDVGDAELVET